MIPPQELLPVRLGRSSASLTNLHEKLASQLNSVCLSVKSIGSLAPLPAGGEGRERSKPASYTSTHAFRRTERASDVASSGGGGGYGVSADSSERASKRILCSQAHALGACSVAAAAAAAWRSYLATDGEAVANRTYWHRQLAPRLWIAIRRRNSAARVGRICQPVSRYIGNHSAEVLSARYGARSQETYTYLVVVVVGIFHERGNFPPLYCTYYSV